MAKIRERRAVNKQGSHKVHMERFSLNKLNDADVKEKYRVQIGLQLWKISTLRLKLILSW
jgi:hypothetical protein